MTSRTWKDAQDMSWPNISRYISFSSAVALTSVHGYVRLYSAGQVRRASFNIPMSWLRTSTRHSFNVFCVYSFSLPLCFRSPWIRSYSDFSNLCPSCQPRPVLQHCLRELKLDNGSVHLAKVMPHGGRGRNEAAAGSLLLLNISSG